MKKIVKILLCLIIGIGILCFFIYYDDEETIIENQGNDIYTLMIYMCGSDLESNGGYASEDIKEMLEGYVDEKVNILIETGGSNNWQEFGISNTSNQIYKIENNELKLIRDDLGIQEMTDSNTLINFIQFCKESYPADKYSLIFWDHGGGAVSGFGYDENAKDKNDTLTIDEIKDGLTKAEIKLEFLGFDACLMATVETAYSVKDNAKYLIASEEIEPGTGWNYKKIINKISSNTSIDTIEISKIIVDSFIDENNGNLDFEDTTLSVVDLSKMDLVYQRLNNFMQEIEVSSLNINQFAYISKAIENTKKFAEGEYDTIDLIDFAKQINNSKSDDLIKEVQNAVVYYKNSDLVNNSNGLTVYWPYSDLSYYDKMLKIYKNIGMGNDYIDVLTKFVNLMAGGRKSTYELNSQIYSVENSNYESYSWYDNEFINENQEYYNETEYEKLEIIDKGEYYALNMSDDDWDNIVSIDCEVMIDDGEGYIDLGCDDYYEFDKDGDLKVSFDGTWLSIENQIVPFYIINSTDDFIKGKIPAILNDEEVSLIVIWNNENPDGKIIGAEREIEYGETMLSSRGLIQLKKGDKIKFLFDYYTYDGNYESSYIYGDELIVNDINLKVNYMEIEDVEFLVYYKITDIYNNEYYTESVTIY